MANGTYVFKASSIEESTGSAYPDAYQYVTKDRYVRRLTDPAHLTNYAVNLVRLAPGGQSSCRHAHSKQDEFVYMMEGELALNTDAGRRTVTVGDCVGFPAGTGDAHHFVNETDQDASFLVIGDRSSNDTVAYPDDDMAAKLDADGKLIITHKDGSPY